VEDHSNWSTSLASLERRMHTSLDMQRNRGDVVLQHSVKIAIVFLFYVK
jgi:hypothetical protein